MQLAFQKNNASQYQYQMIYEANKVSARLIEELSPEQLTQLLLILVHLECRKHSLQGFHYVSQKISVADGGEDARVEVKSIEKSEWFHNSLTLFQCKATDLGPAACKKELLESVTTRTKTTRLKPIIKDVLDRGGQYILFISTEYGKPRGIRDRVAKLREGAGKKYALKQFLIYDAQKISEWTNDFISAVTFVLECNNKSRPRGFRTWSQWGRDIEFQLTYPFVFTSSLVAKTQWLKDGLETSNCLRILGHSGIGKSRFLFEALSPLKSNHRQNILNSSVVYVDLALTTFESISEYLISSKDSTVATFVIDNCPDKDHTSLSRLVKSNSKIKIITADFSLETDEEESCVTYLVKDEQRQVVVQMLQTMYKGKYGDEEIRGLVELAEGYPQMVELLQHAIEKDGLFNLNPDLPTQFVKRLIFGREQENEVELNILKCCSIFSEFAFADEESSQLTTKEEETSIKKTNTYIAKLSHPDLSYREFVKACKKIRHSRRILERRGLTYSVVPTPLAAHLAADWLIEFPDADFHELSVELTRHGLIDSFCKRLKTLDQIDRARNIVSKLWGPGGPFVSAEVLNTELGSRLFCSVVEVSPEATIESLKESLSQFTDAELKESVGPGRRYLIWALEKLVFRKETFHAAGRLLARFAVAENETISNNATSQFLHLFHVYLPGTEVNYHERISLIESLLPAKNQQYERLVISALGTMMYMGHFDRMGGAEKQGTAAPFTDFVPSSWEEIYQYWEYACNRLQSISVSNSDLKSIAKQKLAESIRWVFENGKGSLIANSIREIVHSDSSVWEDAITNLRDVARFKTLNDVDRQLITDLLKVLLPVDIENQIKFTISLPDWSLDDPLGSRGTLASNAETLAADLIERDIDLTPYLRSLLTGEQRQTYPFAKKLSEIIDDPLLFGHKILIALKSLDETQSNLELLFGYLAGLPQQRKRLLVDAMIEDNQLNQYAFSVTRAIVPEWGDLAKLFPLVDSKKVEPYQFNNFVYGRYLEKLNVQQVIQFSEMVFEYGSDGKWAALNILSQHTYSDETLWAQCKACLRRFVMTHNYLMPSHAKVRVDYYRWSMVVQHILAEGTDRDVAQSTSLQIIEASKHSLMSFQSYLSPVIEVLVEKYFQIFWTHISPVLIASGSEYFRLRNLLGTRNGNSMTSEGILFSGDNTLILEWCKLNTPKGPKRIGYMMPVFNKNKSKELTWHPFAKDMIDEFGDIDGFLNEVAANLGTFGSVGSVIPYYRDQQELMRQLFNHKRAAVRKWSRAGFASLEKIIGREQLKEEQDYLD
jgi:hypothetical protein